MKLAIAYGAAQSRMERQTVGLVLGAGGVLGGAWVAGALHAITMTRQLHASALGERLAELPRLVRRLPRHQSGWLGFSAVAHERWAEVRAA